jgi:hypothetical protein
MLFEWRVSLGAAYQADEQHPSPENCRFEWLSIGRLKVF